MGSDVDTTITRTKAIVNGASAVGLCAFVNNSLLLSLRDVSLSLRAQFRANTCNTDRVITFKRNFKWRRPPSWIYFRCRFWSREICRL